MTENIKALMEDFGCNEDEARQALELAGGNLEQAIINIGIMLKYITAYKAKINFKQKSIFGLIHIIANSKNADLLRFSSVMSYNPIVYEYPVSVDWFSFEKSIYSYRLTPGVIENYTKTIDTEFKEFIAERLNRQKILMSDDMKNLFEEFFVLDDIEIDIVAEELTLREFRKLPNYENVTSPGTANFAEVEDIKLETIILEDTAGKNVENIIPGDVVLAIITDTRDISYYIGHLLGARKENEMIPMPAAVKKIEENKDYFDVSLKYADLITGVSQIKKGRVLKVLGAKRQPWWKSFSTIFTFSEESQKK